MRAHHLSHFLIYSKVNMASIVDPQKVVDRKSAYFSLPCAQNGIENKKIEKIIKKKGKKPKVNLIIFQVNHTILILNPKLDPKPLDTLIIP